ncbi:MAG: UDP-3-O-(3-hydroxymyristoyl)glucosamine N-acyltransferase [Paracoccaceae bacterium]|nr:UDP-3-O-(3-hydroxymyristoyl)glucosamine N-acyltransferase [Paracoccaceae bacterium]
MTYSIKDIAAALGAEATGDTELRVVMVREPASASRDDLALAIDPKYAPDLAKSQARVAMIWEGADWQAFGLKAAILAPRPRYALAGLSALMDPGQGFADGIDPSAVVSESATIAADVSIGPLSVISAGAVIGASSRIGPMCFVGNDTHIGEEALLREGVKIAAGIKIGARFIAQPGASIGGDGFSFVTVEVSAVEKARETLGNQDNTAPQSWARIHSLGSVQIGDDVEIGANSCVDRGTIRDTQIGNGVKIDNLTQIGHNVTIGNDCLICAQVGVAGSTRIGNNVVLGGQTGVSDNLFIGDRVITGGATKVLSNIPEGRVMLGYPAMKMDTHLKIYKALRRLPRALRDVAALQKETLKNGKGT